MNEEEAVIRGRLEKYAEGNKYLYEALLACHEKKIETYAYCVGHDPLNLPFFAIIINKESLNVIRNIIANLQDMKDISMEYVERYDIYGKLLKTEVGKGFVIRGALNNRCEMFYRISEGIRNQQEHPKTTINSEMFFRRVETFFYMDADEVELILKDGRVIGGIYSNDSDDFREYNKNIKDIKNNPIIRKISEKFTKRGKKNKDRFERLNKIYGKIQNEYTPNIKETIKQTTDDVEKEKDFLDELDEYEYKEYLELNKKENGEKDI